MTILSALLSERRSTILSQFAIIYFTEASRYYKHVEKKQNKNYSLKSVLNIIAVYKILVVVKYGRQGSLMKGVS